MIENLKHKNKYGRTTTLALNVFYTLSLSTFLFSVFCYFQIGIRGVIFKALLSYSILNTINIMFFYLHKKILKSYVIASVLGYITLLFVCSHSGGINSPAISFLVLIIFFGYLIKKGYGNIWLVTVLVTVVAFYIMNKYSLEMVNEINEENITEFNLLFLLFLIVLLGGVFGRMMNKTNERIKRAKKEIVKRNDEKTIMLKEIHHRVKNNLQVVNSLLRIQARGVKDEKVKLMFSAAQSRVVAMARLHEKIYNTKDLKNIDISEHFELLINDLISSINLDKKITTKLNIEAVNMSIDTLLPLSLIINELVSNSLKHAFCEMKSGEVVVELFTKKGIECQLFYSDNGKGMQKNILSESENSTGLTLIKTFVRQLNGVIVFLNKPKGISFEISFINSSIE
ncbi:MAG: hypothetical protein COA88_13405 [Kordia sp.]|nr:MAG: hypothetical protein COA88_13405 [Kordia sp.]